MSPNKHSQPSSHSSRNTNPPDNSQKLEKFLAKMQNNNNQETHSALESLNKLPAFDPDAKGSVPSKLPHISETSFASSETITSPNLDIHTRSDVPETITAPLYVNAKQYDRIVKRRIERAQLSFRIKRNPKKQLGYEHECRHVHAMKRPRNSKGKFLTKSEIEANKLKESTQL